MPKTLKELALNYIAKNKTLIKVDQLPNELNCQIFEKLTIDEQYKLAKPVFLAFFNKTKSLTFFQQRSQFLAPGLIEVYLNSIEQALSATDDKKTDSIQHFESVLETDPKLFHHLFEKLPAEKLVWLGKLSEIFALKILQLPSDQLEKKLGKYEKRHITGTRDIIFKFNHSPTPDQDNSKTSKFLGSFYFELAQSNPQVKAYILEHHRDKMNPDDIKMLLTPRYPIVMGGHGGR